MAKGKSKFSSSEGAAPAQHRSLRSRKRECPSDETSQTGNGEAALLLQDSEGNKTAVVITPLQRPQSPLQKCATITNQMDQTAEQYCKEGEEKLAGNMLKDFEGQGGTSATSKNNDSQLQGIIINPENYTNEGEKEEINPQEVTRSPSQTYSDQHQVLPSVEGDGSCDEQLVAKKNCQCNLQINHETSQEEPNNMCTCDIEEVTKESAVELPARKKRRMGMCGLTEKERSHFLQTQKRENRQNGVERAEKQLCNNRADLVAEEEIISSAHLSSSPLSIQVDSLTVQRQVEGKLQSSQCGADNRAEPEVCVTVTTSDRASALHYPGCTEGKSNETKGGAAPDPEQTDEPKSNQPAGEKVEGHLKNLKQQECEGSAGKIPVKLRKDEEDSSTCVNCSPVSTVYTDPCQNEATEKNKDGTEAAPLQVQSMTRSEETRKDKMMGGTEAEAGADSTESRPGGFSGASVELCEAAVTPSNSERKDNCAPDVEPAGSSTVITEHTQTRDTAVPFGPGNLDYVSDSQLNSIPLIEHEMLWREEDSGLSYCHEDATNLMCGLITELSSLNRKVMAMHRELENLRRGSNTSRSSTR